MIFEDYKQRTVETKNAKFDAPKYCIQNTARNEKITNIVTKWMLGNISDKFKVCIHTKILRHKFIKKINLNTNQ